ncbi:TonB-dependent receptor [Luteimonas saliphila]|uniref:TonB-dependent receptor n=1 Tax=Luteimonas saliphila TaxID=2804919 RepID=UPI001EE39DE2|nr:TonB-dependent receptor [Luteimonas saliphila]
MTQQACTTTLHRSIVKALHAGALVAAFGLLASTTAFAQTAEPIGFDIPEQPLSAALKAFAEQSGMQLLYRPESINGETSRPLRGQLDKRQALRQLLADTDLEVVYSAENAATIRPRGKEPVTKEGNTSEAATEVGSGVQGANVGDASDVGNEQPTASERSGRAQDLETVVVTGTRIRGGETPSPVITIGSERIQEEGFIDLGEVIRSVPQNFTGGQNPGVLMGNVAGGGLANQNVTGGSSLNLRGLGPDASLTLLNGRRMSYGGFVQAVDISAIPVEAVERVEIVADGASAIYGSDAVGGVANVILKRDFDGLALGSRYGTATVGGLTTREYTATAGAAWASGGLIATYKNVSTDPIYARQRDYTDQLFEPSTIYPGSGLRSGLLSAYQSIGTIAELRLDALRTDREQDYYYYYGSPSPYNVLTPESTTSLVSPSIEFSLPNDWLMSIAGAWGRDRYTNDHAIVSNENGLSTPYLYECWCNESRAYDVGAEGPLFALGGDVARLAIGVGYRENEYVQNNFLTGSIAIQADEGVRYAYAEVHLPFMGAGSNIAGMRRLALTAAVRSEDYESFGSVTTPKLGLVYGPSADFTIKASWGESFKAPTLYQRYNAMIGVAIHPSAFGGSGYAEDDTLLFLNGGSRDLDAERARTWTASLAFHPDSLPGLDAELTWFDIDYTDRVVQPITTAFGALDNPIYAEFVDHSPTAERLVAIVSRLDAFYNFTGAPYDSDNVVAILDARYVNATRQRIKGLDLSGSYRFDLGTSQLTIRGAASWLDSTQQTAGVPSPYDLAGTLHNPAKVNSRIGAVWSQGGFSTSTFANYTSGVTNTADGEKSASFTTFDVTLRYVTRERDDTWSGIEFGLSAQNLLDRAPPLYLPTSPMYVPPYDSTNYSAIGRFLSFTISKRW